MTHISTGAAHAIRKGIILGRLIAIDVAMWRLASDPSASWRFVEPYQGLHRRLYHRAVDRAADDESQRIIQSLLTPGA